jgi:accessory colonization factor AcfC
MSTCLIHSRWYHCVLVLALGAVGAAGVSAADTLRVYGSEGPSPAIREAAMAFQENNGVEVEVVSGPVTKWLDQAKSDADVIFCSAEFMMSDLVRAGELQINPSSITPLYTRPSAILVRPGNPRGIRDFPDLLRPGMRVMVVTGSGQTGLWEDMAGKRGNVGTIRAFRKNVVFFAPDSDTAQRTWVERDDIDAWVTWNIWHLPLHEHADLVPVSDDYVIYRQCNVALTERGKAKPAGARFIAFLASSDGARIFKSWDWITPLPNPNPVVVKTDIAVVCRVDKDECKNGVGVGLIGVQRLVNGYKGTGTPEQELHVTAVVHDDAAYWMLKDQPYRLFTKRDGDNPNKALVMELIESGVCVELCAQTMQAHGWTKDDVLPGVKLIPDAYPRIVDLQLQGYAYLRF